MERIELLRKTPTLFLDGPIEYLCKVIASELLKVPQFKAVFGEFIDGYKRMDYSIRALPVARIYNQNASKSSDTAFITGDLLVDIIFPASLRRDEVQQIIDTISGAIWQQFRRAPFFFAVRALVPGLNELGRVLSVDKSLGYLWQSSEDEDEIVPMTQFTVNFKVDLAIWDDYLTAQCRTVEDPFERTLKELEKINVLMRGVEGTEPTPAEIELETEIQV